MISTLSTVCVTWLQNVLTGNKLYACNAFCHLDAQRVTMSPGGRHYRRAKLFQPVQAGIRTLPRRRKSQLLLQCCRSVYIIHSPVTLPPTKLNFVPEVPGHRESFLMRLRELLPGPGWVTFLSVCITIIIILDLIINIQYCPEKGCFSKCANSLF